MSPNIPIVVAIALMVVAAITPTDSIFAAFAALAVFMLAVAFAIQANSLGRYPWLWGFIALAAAFNPFTAAALPRAVLLALMVVATATFVAWGALLARKMTTMSVSQVLHPSDTK